MKATSLAKVVERGVIPMGLENSIEQCGAHYDMNRNAYMTKTRDGLDF